jgi:hypothetical protein
MTPNLDVVKTESKHSHHQQMKLKSTTMLQPTSIESRHKKAVHAIGPTPSSKAKEFVQSCLGLQLETKNSEMKGTEG